ncbi:hypothetical protein ACJMK2_041054 [Sinanodonta woodiana]|uniref:IgGFc-binding protein N-terminal domain-containing protein n=1 Tax=Sinanodonta woodiana TaxID=1069815 RepID=A0ABD3W5R8_SINWO
MFRNLLSILLYTTLVPFVDGLSQEASFTCAEDPNNSNLAIITFSLLKHDDIVHWVYGYNASTASQASAYKMTTCVANDSAVNNSATDPIQIVVKVDIAASVQTSPADSCGIHVETDPSTSIKTIRLRFRSQGFADVVTSTDKFYEIACTSNNLQGDSVSTNGSKASSLDVIIVNEPQRRTKLNVLEKTTRKPLTQVTLGQQIFLSFEYDPGSVTEGPDNYGTEFYVGFLGNDPPGNEASTASLKLLVYARYSTITTFITVETKSGTETKSTNSTAAVEFTIPSNMMGCSNEGEAEIVEKGVHVSATREVGVVVINSETKSLGYYTALPVDVLGTSYYAVSYSSSAGSSEMMVLATEDNTRVNITIPVSKLYSVKVLNSTYSPGSTVSITLNKRYVFHLAQKTETLTGYYIVSDKPVSVLSGNRVIAIGTNVSRADHLVDQLLPTKSQGKHFILFKAPPGVSESRVTYYKVIAMENNTTITKGDSNKTIVGTLAQAGNEKELQITSENYEIFADKPVMVVQFVSSPISELKYDPAMTLIPSVEQWGNSYTFPGFDTGIGIVFIVKTSDLPKLVVNGNAVSLTSTNVTGPANAYKYVTMPNLGTGTYSLKINGSDIAVFLAVGYSYKDTETGGAYLPFGYRYTKLVDCANTTALNGDLLDNDCDGLIDEEMVNGLDDDGDGLVDEDTVASARDNIDFMKIRPRNIQASGTADFTALTKAITGSNGCRLGTSGEPFYPSAECAKSAVSTADKVVIDCGLFESVRFEESNMLYFQAALDYCFKSTDPLCATICQPGAIGKRAVNTDNVPTVNTSVLVTTSYGNSANSNGDASSSSPNVNPAQCVQNTYILVILILLLVALILSFTSTVYFFCKFKRERNKKEHHRS